MQQTAMRDDIIRDTTVMPDNDNAPVPPSSTSPPKHGTNTICPYLTSDNTDQIAPLIRQAIERHRLKTFSNFSLVLTIQATPQFNGSRNIFVHPPWDAASIRDSHGNFLGWQYYYFDVFGQLTPIALKICLSPPSASGQKPGVQVKYHGCWLSITHFLSRYPKALEHILTAMQQTPETLWDYQWKWWVAMNKTRHQRQKTFPIMELPAEIRELIYGHVYPSPTHPFPKSGCRRLPKLELNFFRAAQPSGTVLFLTKQIYSECRRVIFSDNLWFIPHTHIMDKILYSDCLRTRVQRLHLQLSHAGFLRLFSTETEFHVLCIQPLRTMRLRELVLDFAPPARVCGRGPDWASGAKVLCQRVFINWILDIAEKWVVGHAGVSVIGAVRTGQKEKFEKLCKDGLREFRRWEGLGGEDGLLGWDAWREEWKAEMVEEGGVRLVEVPAESEETEKGDEEVEDGRSLVNLRRDGPPECRCKVGCEMWSPYAWVP